MVSGLSVLPSHPSMSSFLIRTLQLHIFLFASGPFSRWLLLYLHCICRHFVWTSLVSVDIVIRPTCSLSLCTRLGCWTSYFLVVPSVMWLHFNYCLSAPSWFTDIGFILCIYVPVELQSCPFVLSRSCSLALGLFCLFSVLHHWDLGQHQIPEL